MRVCDHVEGTIKKWGNSPALRLSATIMKTAAFELDQRVSIQVSKGRIVIEPAKNVAYDLDELLAGITDENLHGEVDFGGPVGKEAL